MWSRPRYVHHIEMQKGKGGIFRDAKGERRDFLLLRAYHQLSLELAIFCVNPKPSQKSRSKAQVTLLFQFDFSSTLVNE